MDDYMRGGAGGGGGGAFGVGHQYPLQHHQYSQPAAYQVAKAVTGVTAGGSLLLLSGLTLVGTVLALIVATPLLVLFSPVLVPAAITVVLLIGGFLASGAFGLTAVLALGWLYRYTTGQGPPGMDQLEQARMKLAGKARDVRDKGHDEFRSTYHQATTTA